MMIYIYIYIYNLLVHKNKRKNAQAITKLFYMFEAELAQILG
jgi:flagellin-specific chaperone FliS